MPELPHLCGLYVIKANYVKMLPRVRKRALKSRRVASRQFRLLTANNAAMPIRTIAMAPNHLPFSHLSSPITVLRIFWPLSYSGRPLRVHCQRVRLMYGASCVSSGSARDNIPYHSNPVRPLRCSLKGLQKQKNREVRVTLECI